MSSLKKVLPVITAVSSIIFGLLMITGAIISLTENSSGPIHELLRETTAAHEIFFYMSIWLIVFFSIFVVTSILCLWFEKHEPERHKQINRKRILLIIEIILLAISFITSLVLVIIVSYLLFVPLIISLILLMFCMILLTNTTKHFNQVKYAKERENAKKA